MSLSLSMSKDDTCKIVTRNIFRSFLQRGGQFDDTHSQSFKNIIPLVHYPVEITIFNILARSIIMSTQKKDAIET